jgi:hypothetical protein
MMQELRLLGTRVDELLSRRHKLLGETEWGGQADPEWRG